MTAAVHRMGTPSLSIPPSQNTAPVLEFNCLYTHDIRRKQKRWQDGFLRFHTFNKRVMVYDVPRNFIGDMHWKEGEDLQEGDEVTLEKDAVLVQVAESVGRTETDLTELKQSAKKSKRTEGGQKSSSPPRNLATPSRNMGPPTARPGTASVAGGNAQLKHRSLNALLGTPKGRIGKATLPTKSPFETRQAEENETWESGRPPKRSKGESWNLTRTTVPLQNSRRETPLWKRTADARAKAAKQVALPPGQKKLGTKEVIDLSDDGEDSPSKFLQGFSSDAAGPASSPVREVPRPPTPVSRKQQVRPSSPVFQTQKREEKAPEIRNETPPRPAKAARVEPPRRTIEEPEPAASPPRIAPPFLPPPSNKPSQTLRMATSAPKRKTLACLDQISNSPAGTMEKPTSTEDARPTSSKRKTQRELLEERLAKMNKMAQQRADDLNAIVDDADATALEISQMDEAAPPPERPEIRVTSRQTEPAEEPVPLKSDRSFRRVVSEHNTAASAAATSKCIPCAPVRFTPPPVGQAPKPAEQPKQRTEAAVPAQRERTPKKVAPPPTAEPRPAGKEALPPQEQPGVQQSTKEPIPPNGEIPPPPQPPAARRRPGIGRKEIRMSAQACLPTALNVAANGTSTVILAKPFQAPKPPAPPKAPAPPEETGPWTREAFDLFNWRPPGWDEEKWCVSKGEEA
ncbi:hypothetical protein MBLNU13_g11467t1 [Cladosporium sp. NU13]